MLPLKLLFSFLKRTQSKKLSRSKASKRRMSLESLESRELNAIDVSLASDGMLRIIGDEEHNYADVMLQDDQIEVYTTRNRLDDIPDEAIIHRFDSNAVKQIYVEGLGGDDYFINRTALPNVMFGGEGNDILLAGTGRNQLYGEGGLNDISVYGDYNIEQPAPHFTNTLRGPQDQSPLAVYYRQLPNATTVLGQPTNGGEEYVSPNGQAKMRTFENGVIVWTAGNGAVHLVGNMLKKWESLGGFNNIIVGNPTTSEGLYSMTNVSATSDTIQRFEFGIMMHRPTVGNKTFEVHGEIYKKWTEPGTATTKGTLSIVGLPRSDEMPTADGKGRESKFDGGSIKWNRATNTTTVVRSIGMKLVNPGNALSNSLLFLTSVAPARLGGLTMSDVTDNFYTKLGRERGVLGAQVAGEKLIGGKMVFVTEFQFGAIYRTMNSTFEVHGDIYKKYVKMGGPAGVLGLPRTNESAVADSAGGRFNTFEYGAILWTPARGAFEIHGAIWQTWGNMGGVKSSLGYPTSDERDVSVNSEFRIGNFQNGAIVYSDRTGSILLQGALWQQWKIYGAEKSFLGAPSGQAETITVTVNGRLMIAQRMEFEGGTLTVRTGAAAAVNFNFTQMKFALKQIAVEGATVTQAEINLMRSFLKAPHSMPAPVANLLGKVVNGDLANTTYRQTILGNLRANSPNMQLDKLVNKWFGGDERPRARDASGTSLNYAYTNGVLFGLNGPRLLDIDQGGLGDCYLMAALGSVAAKNRQVIEDMIIDNGDDTYTIRFFNGNQAEYVTVDRYLPVNSSGNLVYAHGGRAASLSALQATQSPIWFALIEKAFVIASSSGWIEDQSRSNDFGVPDGLDGINGGNPKLALQHLLGHEVQRSDFAVYEELDGNYVFQREDTKNQFLQFKNEILKPGNEYAILSTTKESVTSAKLTESHAYVIFAADNNGLTLFNPHGGRNAVFQISWGEATGNFKAWTRY